MQMVSFVLGILAILGMFLGFLPCFGWYNYLNIPFAVVGLVIGVVAYVQTQYGSKTMSLVGMICCGAAIVVGIFRLMLSWMVGGFGLA